MKAGCIRSFTRRALIAAALVSLPAAAVWAQTSTAQEIDNWNEGQLLNRSGDVDSTSSQSVEAEEFGAQILGNWRNVFLQKTLGISQNQATFLSTSQERTARFGNAGSTSLTRVFWDGSQRYTKYAGEAENRDTGVKDPLDDYVEADGSFFRLVPSVEGAGTATGGSVDPDTLIGDLTGTCPNDDRGIFLILDQTDQGEVTYTIDVFSPNDSTIPDNIQSFWSSASVSVDANTSTTVFGFYFTEPSFGAPLPTDPWRVFERRGNGGPADFGEVGAIVLTADIQTQDTDVPLGTPIVVGCGTDFGDAPVEGLRTTTNQTFEGNPAGTFTTIDGTSYRTLASFAANTIIVTEEQTCSLELSTDTLSCGPVTVVDPPELVTNASDPETREFRGPHHLINGPFLGLGANDTDAEFDGQPDPLAQGDDCDDPAGDACTGSDDEQALEDTPVFFADFIVNQEVESADPNAVLSTCAGLAMDPEGPLGVGPNTYCVALQVSNPTDRWAQVVGWIDFRGNGAFDNRCGGGIVQSSGAVIDNGDPITDGTVTYESNLRNCERSASRVFIGDLREVPFANESGTDPVALRPAGENPVGVSCEADPDPLSDFQDNSVGAALDQSGDWNGGNIPPGCEGVVVLTWDLDEIMAQERAGEQIITTERTFARFRISTDPLQSGATGCGFFQGRGPTPYCYAADGEVEDHTIEPETLPISIGSFESRFTSKGLEVSWTTVSETENIGFNIWGDTGSDMQVLTDEMVASTSNDLSKPQSYSMVFPGVRPGQFDSLAITGVDTRGREEMFGLFDIDTAHGRVAETDAIDWHSITAAATDRMALMGISKTEEGLLSRQAPGPVFALDLAVTQPGMQRITYEELRDAGLDLAGANPFTIAVSMNGRAVPRVVTLPGQPRFEATRFARGTGTRPPRFGPGAAIEFWGEMPQLPEKLYVQNLVYRVSVDGTLAVEAQSISDVPGVALDAQPHTVRVRQKNGYNAFNANPDPFFAARLRAGRSNDRYAFSVVVDDYAVLSEPGRVQVRVAGETDYANNPDHHVRIQVNGQTVKDYFFDGVVSRLIEAEIPPNLLQHGENIVTVLAPGDTSAPVDMMFLGEMALTYQRQPVGTDNALLIEGLPPSAAAVRADLSEARRGALGFAWDGGQLFQLPATMSSSGAMALNRAPSSTANRTQSFVVPTVESSNAQYWLSAPESLNVPQVVGTVGENAILNDDGPVDFVIIAHPAFMPMSESEPHPLNDFVALRSSEGWNVGLFDILSIQQHFGGGMPLPGAVTRFLRAADEVFDFEHVLLVGDGNYDHLNASGLNAISFIPTIYRATSIVRHTPSDPLLADLAGDGVPDKAVGRWPVRTLDDLRATVTKTVDWQENAEEIQGALWLADRQDRRASSFAAQTGRMAAPLLAAGWPEDRVNRVVWEEVGGAEPARELLIAALNEGRAVMGFSGHASSRAWGGWGVQETLLVPDDVGLINNIGLPTLIGTMSCYTSYSVSPHTDTIAHRMMNGYLRDSTGSLIPGAANGAVAIHGAATLSNLAQNEIVAKRVLENQLSGMTLGEAIEEARLNAWQRGLGDQVINWTLLGDPTLMLNR